MRLAQVALCAGFQPLLPIFLPPGPKDKLTFWLWRRHLNERAFVAFKSSFGNSWESNGRCLAVQTSREIQPKMSYEILDL